MIELEKEIIPDDLDERGREISDLIGLDNYIKLAKMYTSDSVYIGSYERIINRVRNRIIKREYNGINSKQLAKKYKLSRRWIQSLTEMEETKKYREMKKRNKEYMEKNQINLFENE